MDRAAVFVDAGYLFAAGSKLIANTRLPRGQINLDHDAILSLLNDVTAELTGLPLLRIYWYDGTATGPTPQQLALGYRANIKVRLGFVNHLGTQKGVDALVVSDLITLARNGAIADAVLLTGDDDIRVGVQHAQEFGIRVHLLGIAPSRENQSGFLVQEADSLRELDLAEVQTFLTQVPATMDYGATPQGERSASSHDLAPDVSDSLVTVARRIVDELSDEEREAVLAEAQSGAVPPQVDRRLLIAGSQAMGGDPLTSQQKRHVRNAFLDACQR